MQQHVDMWYLRVVQDQKCLWRKTRHTARICSSYVDTVKQFVACLGRPPLQHSLMIAGSFSNSSFTVDLWQISDTQVETWQSTEQEGKDLQGRRKNKRTGIYVANKQQRKSSPRRKASSLAEGCEEVLRNLGLV